MWYDSSRQFYRKQEKEGVKVSSRMDMINGSLGDKIIKYALPLAVTGVLQQLFNAADLAVVGQFSGKEAMAAVGSKRACDWIAGQSFRWNFTGQ